MRTIIQARTPSTTTSTSSTYSNNSGIFFSMSTGLSGSRGPVVHDVNFFDRMTVNKDV
jgi:hypothetical protein